MAYKHSQKSESLYKISPLKLPRSALSTPRPASSIMSAPGKIQTVYTTSKRGKRERLGEWFLRSANSSRSKRKQHSQISPSSESVRSPPVTVTDDQALGNHSGNDNGEADGTDEPVHDSTSNAEITSEAGGTNEVVHESTSDGESTVESPAPAQLIESTGESQTPAQAVEPDPVSYELPNGETLSMSAIHEVFSIPPTGHFVTNHTQDDNERDPRIVNATDELYHSEDDDSLNSPPSIVHAPVADSQEIDESEYWGRTRDIEEDKLVALLNRVCKSHNGTVDAGYKLMSTHCGSYNCAYILESSYKERLCVRVPACGFPERWNDFDGKLLRESALGMKYIRNKTDLPVPRLISYTTSMDNEIGAPYIVMSFLAGKPLEEVWPRQQHEDFEATEARRMTMLQSLAKTMRLLEPTVFPRYGALLFDSEEAVPTVGDTSRLTTDDIFVIHRKFKALPSRASLSDYVLASRRHRFQDYHYPEEELDHLTKGLFMLWELMLDCFLEVVKLEPNEPDFVLMQSDFNPQNILVDDRGNISGLIDWDCLEAIPRQVGWCSTPHWLKKDWTSEYTWPTPEGSKQILEPHEFDKYRKAYARYIREACPGKNDSRFTAKSHIYWALLQSGEHFDSIKPFVCKVLNDILPRLSGAHDVFISTVGEQGFQKDKKKWLELQLRDFFSPDACHVCDMPRTPSPASSRTASRGRTSSSASQTSRSVVPGKA